MRWMVLAADGDSGLPAYAYLFWALFIGYAAWYGVRLYRKSADRRSGRTDIPPLPPTTSTPPPTPRPAATPRPAVDAPPAAPAAPSTPAPAPTPAPTPTPTPVPPAEAADASARSGFFSAAPSGGRPAEQARRPVAAILQGISMPDALAPVINSDAVGPSGLRVAFSASSSDPGRVGRAVGDELERLGFTLQSLGDTQLGATRDHDELVVTIYTDPAAVERLGEKAFPVLPAGAFVVEFESV